MEQSVQTLALFETAVLGLLTTVLTWWYRSAELTPTWICVIVGFAWFLGFSSILLLPLDLAQANTGLYSGSGVMLNLWLSVFWSTFLMAWLILPVIYEAWYAGEYTWKGRLKASLRANARFYLMTGCLGAIFCAYLMYNNSLSPSALRDFLLVFGNTYGLLLVIALLGNGLVEVPRTLWRLRDREEGLQRIQMRAVLIDEEVYDAQCEWEDCYAAARRMARRVDSKVGVSSEPAAANIRRLMDQILLECTSTEKSVVLRTHEAVCEPEDPSSQRPTNMPRRNRGNRSDLECSEKSGEALTPTIHELVAVSKRIRHSKERNHTAIQRWQELLRDHNRVNNSEQSPSSPQATAPPSGFARLESFLCQGVMRSEVASVLSLLCAGMSALVLWSELAMGFPISMSPWGLLIAALSEVCGPAVIQLVAFVPYAYMSLCTFYSLFKLKVSGLLSLHAPHQSTPGPMLLNAIYLIRLQFPLGYNYLLLLSPPSALGRAAVGDDVVFNLLMKSMQTIPIFGASFVVYAPIVLVCVSLFTLSNGYSRFLSFANIDHEDHLPESLEDAMEIQREGAMILAQATRRRRLDARSTAWEKASHVQVASDDVNRQFSEGATEVPSDMNGATAVTSPLFRASRGFELVSTT